MAFHWLVLLFLLQLSQAAATGEDVDNMSRLPSCLNKKNKTLHLVVMAPLPDSTPSLMPGWVGGPAVIPGTRLAVDHVNSRCDVLADYRLELLVADSGCDVSSKAVISTLMDLFYSGVSVIGIIGPGCSAATIFVGKLLAQRGVSLLNIAPSATSPALVNQTAFPNTFRPIASSLGFIDAHSDFIAHQGYTKVAIVFEAQRGNHKAASSRFQKKLQENDLVVFSFGMFDSFIPISIFRNNFRIIFVFAGTSMSRKLMCYAYHKGMTYPTYQYIFVERRLRHFMSNVSLVLDGTRFKCGEQEMQQAIVGVILNLIQLTRPDVNTILVNNMSYDSFNESYTEALEAYRLELGLNKSEIVDTEHQSGYYDSTWALALSLNASMPRLEAEFNKSLSDYRFGYPAITKVIRDELLKVSFEGVRGTVQFNNETLDAIDVTVFDMFQIQMNGTVKLVARYNPANSSGGRLEVCDNSSFISDEFTVGVITPPIYVEVIVFLAVVIAMSSTVLFHILNTLWVGVKSMKVTSPNLNHMIFSGCYLYLLSIVFMSLQLVQGKRVPVLYGVMCSAFIWCESIALTLIFATTAVKMWRVYRIFSHSSATVLSNLEDRRLVVYVLALLLVDIVFNVSWNLINPWFMYKVAEDGLRVRLTCNCDNLATWLACLLTLKVGLVFLVFYFSIITRRIPKREYKQTKSVNALIYSLTFLYCFTIPMHLILLGKTSISMVTVSYLSLCFKNLVCVLLCTIFIFMPPVLPVLKQKWTLHAQRERVYSVSSYD